MSPLAGELPEHLRNPHCVIPCRDATGRLDNPPKAENVEDGGAFVGAALGDDEITAAVGRGSAPRAFGDVEDDADGGPFELITKSG